MFLVIMHDRGIICHRRERACLTLVAEIDALKTQLKAGGGAGQFLTAPRSGEERRAELRRGEVTGERREEERREEERGRGKGRIGEGGKGGEGNGAAELSEEEKARLDAEHKEYEVSAWARDKAWCV